MILVTGATGLVGSHLIWRLLKTDNQIVALKRMRSNIENVKNVFKFYTDNPDEYFARIEWIQADINDRDTLFEALRGIKEVYHCAAMVNLGKNNHQMVEVNTKGTINLIDAALANKVEKICYVSSIAALGDALGAQPINESDTAMDIRDMSTYGYSKLAAEQAVFSGIAQGLKAVIVNPGVILGYTASYSGTGELFRRVKNGLPFYTNGVTGYIAVQDVAICMQLLMESSVSGERFILVAENCTHKDVLCSIADGYGKYRPFIGMGKALVVIAGILEKISVVFGFTSLIDSVSAKTAISKKRYSSQKFLSFFPNYHFISISEAIHAVCKTEEKLRNKR